MSDPLQRLGEKLVTLLAEKVGIELTAEELVAHGTQALALVGDLLTNKAKRDADAAAEAAAGKITTLEEAEASAKRPR